MSCGRPHETPCSKVLEHLDEFLDGELNDSQLVKFRQHVNECAPCLREYNLEDAVKRLVKKACDAEKAPEALRLRVTRIYATRLQGGQAPPAR